MEKQTAEVYEFERREYFSRFEVERPIDAAKLYAAEKKLTLGTVSVRFPVDASGRARFTSFDVVNGQVVASHTAARRTGQARKREEEARQAKLPQACKDLKVKMENLRAILGWLIHEAEEMQLEALDIWNTADRGETVIETTLHKRLLGLEDLVKKCWNAW